MEKLMAIKIITDAWHSGVEKINKLLTSLSDEEFEMEVAPGKNKAKLIIALLAALNDSAIEVLGIGKMINPDVFNYFKVDDRTLPIPATNKEIRQYWLISCQLIDSKIKDWRKNHVSKLPSRNV